MLARPRPFMSTPHLSAASQILADTLGRASDTAGRAAACQTFLSTRITALRTRHDEGADGPTVADTHSADIDELLAVLLGASENIPADAAVVAIGAYGRRALHPQTPPRFLILTADSGHQTALAPMAETLAACELVAALPAADVAACEQRALKDFEFARSLMDARHVAGNPETTASLIERAASAWTGGNAEPFLARLLRETGKRHQRHSATVFLQEPNVKESCGGLDDLAAIRAICLIKQGTADLRGPFAGECLPESAPAEIEAAVSFLHHIRNELHFHTQAPTDRLTLQLQGVVAKDFQYPQRDILRRTEALMRDYYRHTLALYQHTRSVIEHAGARNQADPTDPTGLSDPTDESAPALADRFDGFVVREGRLEASTEDPFGSDPHRLMRMFLHCQTRHLSPGPRLRQLIAAQLPNIDRGFRHSKSNRETFQAILERKGEVAATLRLMHRCGVLGRYLPEFGALDCLVQHEFFHRYTADEHTLRCIDELDRLFAESRPDRAIFRRLLLEIADPFALYLAVILHDTGRAENVREHIDGSAMLAAKLCSRLHIEGPRRTLIMFLVDNHLTFWRTATTRNLEDSDVIAEFAAVVKTQSNLDALLLFTFADSNGTAPDAWNGWKESLMLQLHSATRRFLDGGGREAYDRQLETDRLALRAEVAGLMKPESHAEIERHFELMPPAAFHYREARHLVAQIRTVRQFLQAENGRSGSAANCIKWLDYPGKGYTEMILATRDRPQLLEQLCCALAACEINILSADFFTRADHLVVDVFRVCTREFEPVADPALRESFLDCFQAILTSKSHDPARYLHHLADADSSASREVSVPVMARVCNHLHPTCTAVEIQAVDRIGILHDLFHTINRNGLTTAHARICTEKGVAMDTLYITTHEGGKITDPAVLSDLSRQLDALVGCPETTG